MKRITSTLLVAALPALAMPVFSSLLAPGPMSTARVGQQGSQQGGLQGGQQGNGRDDGLGDPAGLDQGLGADEDEALPPEGFDPKNREGYDLFGRRTKVRGNTFEERLQGGWRLVRMDLAGSNPTGRLAQGFLNISPSFLSMEIHALWEEGSDDSIPENDIHTTFTAEYKVDNGGKLYCSTVIGSFVDEETGELIWERTGYEREYRVREILNQLELTFSEEGDRQSRLVFEPYLPREAGQRDIFGRKEMGSFGATDIFGRNSAAEKGERDIYGRPVAPPAEGSTGEEGKRPPIQPLPKGPGAGGAPLSGRGGR
ncbi:hypothetical protein Poly30_56070 [Planctomycetes bacterium Poly30]|uniref:Uncharacterized protein n=1 Tax=Saltatorellus ferox TaxID=2528018 RepID=A0A518F132_9BACT|nr:hypothetical protein Poly30_56070 [Planctomycetes bacterium Poly30]